MRLLRVQVPEFRALKDVDISFEPEFTPQVFPLGSLNGGGKSTLLQLIFVLLNLPLHDCDSYLKEMYLKDILAKHRPDSGLLHELATITLLNDEDKIELKYFYGDNTAKPPNDFKQSDRFYKNSKYSIDDNNSLIRISSMINENHDSDNSLEKKIRDINWRVRGKVFLISPSNQSYLFFTSEERHSIYASDNKKYFYRVLERLKPNLPNLFTYDFIDVLIKTFYYAEDKDYIEGLENSIYTTHYEQLENIINNLFIDGKKITLLHSKQKRHIKNDIIDIFFKLPSGEEIYPEDLSHGELKRLAIFVLIKYHEIQDAIVLMDEIENGFHPDWQRHIVDDLVEWGPSNQFILATHSYELCRGVTPAHVKELLPNLFS